MNDREKNLWKIANLNLMRSHLHEWANFAKRFNEPAITQMLLEICGEIGYRIHDLEDEGK